MINILHKYSDNIKELKKRVYISPSDYKDPKAMETDLWRVYIKATVNGKSIYKTFKSYMVNGMKIDLNRQETHADKIKVAEKIKQTVIYKLEYNPLMIVLILYGKQGAKERYPELFEALTKNTVTIKQAFEEVYESKEESNLSDSRKNQLRQFKNRFLNYIGAETDIEKLTKNQCKKYLLDNYSNRSEKTFNNEKEYLSTYLSECVELDYIQNNFVSGIKNKKVKQKKNKPYSPEQLKEVWQLLKANPILEFYCMHVYFGMLRLIEVNRLKCKDIDLESDYIDVDNRKTGNYKLIFDNRLKERYKELDLSELNKYIFGRGELISDWNNKDGERRRYYTALFKKEVKDKMGLSEEYGINSLRHNAHYSFYMNKRKELEESGSTNAHIEACRAIMTYANKKTISEVETYLREVDLRLNFDYSKYIN